MKHKEKNFTRSVKFFNFRIDEITLVLIIALLILIVSSYNKLHESINTGVEKITKIIDENKLKEIQNMKYADFKKSLNIKNDFCVYVEDENGNVLFTKGSDSLSQDGIICKE